jgi:hypothetical protein
MCCSVPSWATIPAPVKDGSWPVSDLQLRSHRPPRPPDWPERPKVYLVESGGGAVTVGSGCLLPPLSSGGAQVPWSWLRFHIPLIEPDVLISRIRLSDRTSRLHPRRVASKLHQAYESEVPVQVRERIAPAPTMPDVVLVA